MQKIGISLALLATLSGCASIVSGTTQEIALSTDPSVPVKCTAQNERAAYTANGQPGSLLVKRSQSRLEVSCQSDEYAGSISHRAHMEPWFLGNILIGGIIGVIVDPITGAMFAYDDAVKVPLKAKTEAAQTAPAPSFTIVPPAPVAASPAPASSSTYEELVRSGAIVEAPKPAQ